MSRVVDFRRAQRRRARTELEVLEAWARTRASKLLYVLDCWDVDLARLGSLFLRSHSDREMDAAIDALAELILPGMLGEREQAPDDAPAQFELEFDHSRGFEYLQRGCR